MSETLLVVEPKSYVDYSNPNAPRTLYYKNVIIGKLPPDVPKWQGVTTVRLPVVDETAPLQDDGSPTWKTDADGNRLFRDLEQIFPIPIIGLARNLDNQLREALASFDTLARECAEEVSKEYADALRKFAATLRAKPETKATEILMQDKTPRIILPNEVAGVSALMGTERQVDENLNVVR